MRHHHRHHHQYMLSYKWFSQDPSANTLMPSVPEDLNGAFWTPFSDLKSPHPRFGPLLLLMMVNRATIQIHFTEAPVPWAEQQGHISGLSLGVGEWTSSRERAECLKQQQSTTENNMKKTAWIAAKTTNTTANQPTMQPTNQQVSQSTSQLVN